LRPGDLYLSLKDVTHKAELLGAVARVPADVPLGRLTQDTVRIQITSPEVDADYLYWLLRSPHYRAYCKMRGTGTTNLDLSRSDFLGYEFLLPAISEQQAIAEVLGALDDKIAANAALVERADELMHRTFCSLTSVHETPLSTTAEFVNGRAFTKGASGTGRVVVRIAELNSGIGGSTVFSDAVVDDKHLARPGDILFAWSGSLTLHRWFRDEAIVNQHIFKVIPRDGHHAWLVYELLRQKLADFKAIAADKATTMGHIQRHHLDEVVGIPSSSDIDRLNPLMSALWSLALNAEQHSLTLAATRDALLPQLMSGKLRVRDAEAAASEAGA
jgi:type I restriction enzyme S subunit